MTTLTSGYQTNLQLSLEKVGYKWNQFFVIYG